MRRPLRIFLIVLGCAAIAAALAGLALVFPASRSAVLGLLLRGIVARAGYHVVQGQATYARGQLAIRDLQIADDRGEEFFAARSVVFDLDPAGLIGRSDRVLGLRAVALGDPTIFLRHRADGTWNFAALAPHRAQERPPAPTPAPSAALPWRVRVSVTGGAVRVIDPQAVVPAATELSVDGISSDVRIVQFATSSGTLRGTLQTARGSTPVRATLFEDDSLGFGRAALAADDVPLAPVIDAFVPSRAFIVEGGRARIRLTAYALGYARTASKAWHLTGDATVELARLHIKPLVVPVRDLSGNLYFNDGLLSMKAALGDAAGMALRAAGTVRLEGGVQLAVGITQTGALERAKELFAFSRQQDVAGNYSTTVRVVGPPSDLHVGGRIESLNARYERVLLPAVQGSFFYSDGRLAVGARDLASHSGRVWSFADFNFGATPIAVQGIVALTAPAQDIPVAANIMPDGVAQALASVGGPLTQPDGTGYAQLADRAGERIRTFFGSGPDGFEAGPLLYEQGGGQGLAWARRRLPSQSWSGALIASGLLIHVRGGRVAIADILGPAIPFPSLDTKLDGEAFAFEGVPPDRPQPIAVNLRADSLSYDGVELGRVELTAAGRANQVRIRRLLVSGPALTASASGSVALRRTFAPASLALAGHARLDLGAFAQAVPVLGARGSTDGDFAVAYDGARWVGGVRASSADARIGNLPVRGAAAFVAGSSQDASLMGDVNVPGGSVWAFGTLPQAGSPGRSRIAAFIPAFDLAALAPLGLLGATGKAVGFASIGGQGRDAALDAATAIRGSFQRVPYEGDVDVRYGDGTLRSNGSRIALLGNQATIDGAVSGVGSGSMRNAKLALSVRVRDGDLVALDRFTGPNAPITGSYDAAASLGGSFSRPTVDARVDTDIGTIRGVAFNALHGVLRVRPDSMRLSGGTVQLGTSAFALAADANPRTFSIRATSPHVDLTDFNDFFGGKDVFAGIGAFDVAVTSEEHHLLASGSAALDDAALYDYKLGGIQTTFSSSRRGGLHAVITQSGPGGSMRIAGNVGFRSYHGSLPDFGTAVYRVGGRLNDLQVDEALPLIHQENLGLSGVLDANGSMRGTLHQPLGNATFALRNGYLRHIPIENFSGRISSDENVVRLQDAALELPFLTARGSGRFSFANRTIDGGVTLQAVDLAALGQALRLPGSLSGRADGRLAVSGQPARLRAVADVDASQMSFYGVGFDEAKLHAQYAPGEVSIGDSTLRLAGKEGRVNITGTLPVQLHPLALGPRDKAVNFAISAENVDLSALDPVVRRYLTLTGRLDAQATIGGTAGNPVGKGKATIANASVESPLEKVALTGAGASLDFENETITLERLHGQIGSGSLDMKGAAHVVPAAGLRTYAGLQLWTKVALHGAQFNVPDWISGTFDGGFSVTRSGSVPYIAGTLNASNAVIPFSAIAAIASGGSLEAPPQGPVAGIPELRPGHTIVYGGGLWGPQTHVLTAIGQPTPAPAGFSLPSADLDVALFAKNNVRIRGGSSIDLTTTGGVTITSNLKSPTLQGQFQAIRGQVGYFDTTFRVVSGTVTFDPTSGLLPTLNATAVTNVSGAQITLTVSGRVDNLSTDLESNPAMTRDQIIATLLHAPQVAALTSASPTQAQAAITQTAQSYFNAQLSRNLLYPVESALAQQLNIESISLIFNQYGALAVEVRTRFSNDVSAVYQSSVGAPISQAYGMSYRLQDYLALDVLQTSQPDYGLYSTIFNLRYTFR